MITAQTPCLYNNTHSLIQPPASYSASLHPLVEITSPYETTRPYDITLQPTVTTPGARQSNYRLFSLFSLSLSLFSLLSPLFDISIISQIQFQFNSNWISGDKLSSRKGSYHTSELQSSSNVNLNSICEMEMGNDGRFLLSSYGWHVPSEAELDDSKLEL